MKCKLNRLHDQAKHHNTADLWAQFRQLRNIYMREVQKAKKEFSNTRIINVNANDLSSKKFFGFAKECFSKSKDNTMPHIIANNGEITVSDNAKATHFNKFFLHLHQPLMNLQGGSLPMLNAN